MHSTAQPHAPQVSSTPTLPSASTASTRFDVYLNALTRAGLITLTTDTFTNAEGNVINFKRASLTHEGRTRDESEDLAILLPALEDQTRSQSKTRSKKTGRSSPGLSSRPKARSAEAERSASLPLTPAPAGPRKGAPRVA